MGGSNDGSVYIAGPDGVVIPQPSDIAGVRNGALLVDDAFARRSVDMSWASLGSQANDDDNVIVNVGQPDGNEERFTIATLYVTAAGSAIIYPQFSPLENPGIADANWFDATGSDLSSGVDTRNALSLDFADGAGRYTAMVRLNDGFFRLQASGSGALTVKALFGKQ